MRLWGVVAAATVSTAACSPVPSGAGDAGRSDAGGVIDAGAPDGGLLDAERACLDAGWRRETATIAGVERKVLWRAPATWTRGAILVLHGGGGRAEDFCSGGALTQPQIAFTTQAVGRGFAVFALDSTTDVVTDDAGRPCGKRFDFSVLPRPNVDLPSVEWVARQVVPSVRPAGARSELFITGLSTGGYMTIRAASRFNGWVTAFAPLAAGDPYGTDTVCDATLSARESAVGILVDRETRLEITHDGGCGAGGPYPNESPWETSGGATRPPFKQFHDRQDGIVDFSCMEKVRARLVEEGYPDSTPFILDTPGGKNILWHLWRTSYNAPLLDYFSSFTP